MTDQTAPRRTIPYSIVCIPYLLVLSNAFSPSLIGQRKGGTAARGTAAWLQSTMTTPFADINATSYDTINSDGDDDICTIQILMSDTGGGHRASANALKDALESLYPGQFECDIVDIYTEYGPFWPYNDVVRMYKLMAENSWMWDLFFKFGETEFGEELNKVMMNLFCYKPFKKCMMRTFDSTMKRADVVVSVHPLTQDLPLRILSDLDAMDGGDGRYTDMHTLMREVNGSQKKRLRKTPFLTVVTDLGGAHKTWFNPGVDKCFVPSDVLNEKAQSRGLSPSSQIVQFGLPIRKGFWPDPISNSTNQQPFHSMIREQLGIDDIPTVLVVGGGDGLGGIVDIATTLGKSLGSPKDNDEDNPQYQMVVVCGKNQDAKAKLEKTSWPGGLKVNVQGFVSNMEAWMKASDCLVTKAGPGTIAEASICGLPCLLFTYLPGQEEGNIPYVEESGFGKYCKEPKEIADTVSSWMRSPQKLQTMRRAALAASNPSATLNIAQEVAKIALSTKSKRKFQP